MVLNHRYQCIKHRLQIKLKRVKILCVNNNKRVMELQKYSLILQNRWKISKEVWYFLRYRKKVNDPLIQSYLKKQNKDQRRRIYNFKLNLINKR